MRLSGMYVFQNNTWPIWAVGEKPKPSPVKPKQRPAPITLATPAEKLRQKNGASLTIRTVCQVLNISVKQLLSKSKCQDTYRPRQLAMHIIRKRYKMSFPSIGKLFGRDHTTVLYALKGIEKSMESAMYKAYYDDIINRMNIKEKEEAEARKWQEKLITE